MKMGIVLFDIDGTLAPSRCVISEEIEEMLKKLQHLGWKVGVVGGSDSAKHFEQLKGLFFDFNFCENGLVAFCKGEKIAETSIVKHLGEPFIEKFKSRTLALFKDLDLPFRTFNFFEVRTGMINVCPIGREVTHQQRAEFEGWDKDKNVREKLVEILKPEFPELHFSLGGKISIDCFPPGWDKTWCLQFLKDNEIYFFGDMTHKGGNDHEIFNHPRVKGVTVKNPQDTLFQIQNLFFS
jgi:phosphomannomutase